jgi:hypothetical protein
MKTKKQAVIAISIVLWTVALSYYYISGQLDTVDIGFAVLATTSAILILSHRTRRLAPYLFTAILALWWVYRNAELNTIL